MDARITKKRVGHMLSYDWIKIIAIAAAAIVLWSLLFTMTATRATVGQTFYLYSFYDVQMKESSGDTLENLQKKSALSFDVLELNTYQFTDNQQYLGQQMTAFFSAKQGDVLLLTDIPEPVSEGSQDTVSHLQQVATTYNGLFAPLEGEGDGKPNYFTACKSYLNTYYKNGDHTGELDNERLEHNFRTRMRKDKRFKTEKQIAAGIEQERIRIENLKKSLSNVEIALENKVIEIKTTKIPVNATGGNKQEDYEWKDVHVAIDLSKITHITDYLTNKLEPRSAEGLSMVIFDWASEQYDLQFEPITYLDFLIRTYN